MERAGLRREGIFPSIHPMPHLHKGKSKATKGFQ